MANPQFGTTAAHFQALRQYWGEAKWESWCRALAANRPLLVDGNSVVVKFVAQGEALVGLTDSDDIADGQLKGKVFYVWFDAPIEYIGATWEWAEANAKGDTWRSWWYDAKDVRYVEFMGKDNIPFHTVLFPAAIFATGEPWKLVEEMVDRRETAGGGILQHPVQPAIFRLTGEQATAHVESRLQIGRHLRQHGQAAIFIGPV